LDHRLTFKKQEETKNLKLRGLIYHSAEGQHFTSVVVDKEGTLWYHDGIATKNSCRRIANLKDIQDLRALHWINQEKLAAAMYAEEET
jgi:hypothetical protein